MAVDTCRIGRYLAVFCLLVSTDKSGAWTPGKVCRGTNFGLSRIGHANNWAVKRYERLYGNCTYVDGNLELTYLEDGPYDQDLSFLSSIREVSGYVLISHISAFDVIPLHGLRVIRGHTLFEYPDDVSGTRYSLFVADNYKEQSPGMGLKELQLTALHEIMGGSVKFVNNYELCFVNTILWSDILTGEDVTVSYHADNPSRPSRHCGSCDLSCPTDGQLHCWGQGSTMCQTVNRRCHPRCGDSCYGPGATDCCYRECVGGCTGPTPSDCYACERFIDNGLCVPTCPPLYIYDSATQKLVPNPNVKYMLSSVCVTKCPDHLVTDHATCVSACGEGEYPVNGKCEPCEGPCPKVCDAPEHVHSENISNLTGCTVIQGVLRIVNSEVTGTPEVSIAELQVLASVKEITGALVIKRDTPDFTDLSFLRNLRTIHGRQLENENALLIVRSSLRSLGLRSLHNIVNGRVYIGRNSQLCFVDTTVMDWETVTKRPDVVRTRLNGENCPRCSSVCDIKGCWGPGTDDCVSCAGYRLRDRCVDECDIANGYFANVTTRECWPCNPECANSCTGPGNDHCDSCRHVLDGSHCRMQCPMYTYADGRRICRPCHPNCLEGCTGSENRLGPGGCNVCDAVVVNPPEKPRCLSPNSDCPQNYYVKYARDNWTNNRYVECRQCHAMCDGCSGPTAGHCLDCSASAYHQDEDCVASCESDYFTDESTRTCIKCNHQCLRCNGPDITDCVSCRYKKLYEDLEDSDSPFTCTETCPDWAPAELLEKTDDETTTKCVTEAMFAAAQGGLRKGQIGAIVGGVLAALLLIGTVIVVVVYFRRQSARSEEIKARINARLAGEDEILPLAPSSARPDMAHMRIITEAELNRNDVIGAGAFGTVYKVRLRNEGVWVPANENVKIPVAIKVLNEGSSAAESRELLDEARIMASVVHPYCLRIVAVCMTAQLMLVIPLMPLGSLLEYVRKNRANIDSKRMLNWCTQIARGMEYLESRAIVHRDLAARNVLVQNVNVVKITDFGLAKLLDTDQDVFKAAGGKMPIKWLALESIEHRIFTHKSDVWSYGVTLWEIFSYGQRPYEDVRALDIPNYLQKGTRLAQPNICTIDIYMIMIKCWLLDSDCRPTFSELGEEFAKMARDPGRYLLIEGDQQKRMPLQEDYDAEDMIADAGGNLAGPEEALTVDEYLQPLRWTEDEKKQKQGDDDKAEDNDDKKLAESPEVDRKYKGLREASASKKNRDRAKRRSRSTRYTSDPCNVLPPDAANNTPMTAVSAAAAAKPPKKPVDAGERERMLIADEDNYLAPQPDPPPTCNT